ncbi:hypothetical protein LE190_11935 [Massilia oculi]|uniref:Immunity MXAN-0049 protein domain-containing protein n=1 Tax=Massilia hydrophila TaxID=3044279 RepID=A0ABS7YC99_9BURK|nr:hypothetical protein [Massilia oculi]MCA1856627.1 hypothetical protein [Massilia oculi]
MTKYYAIQYAPDGKALPYYLSGDYDPAEWEFSGVEARPLDINTTQAYRLRLSDPAIKELGFDYYDNEPRLVSSRFLEVCRALQVGFKAIPIQITLPSGQAARQDYYIFFAADNISLLDQERSVYTLERVIETGKVMIDAIFPPHPVYSTIEKFACKQIGTAPLFYCIEIMRLVCTETFRERAVESGLKGLQFVPIDEHYGYDLWSDIS